MHSRLLKVRWNLIWQDESSGLFLLEIISCGRKASAERFLYRKFASRVNIRRAGRLITS
ncbi:MAG: urease accessory protein UreD [Lachnospiraceae bacterium]